MATITARTNTKGETKYKVQVRIRRKGVIVHQETETFDRRQAAVAWGKQRETVLASADGMAAAKADDPPLSKAIGRYLEESAREIGIAKQQALRMIAKSELGALRCSHVTALELIKFGKGLKLAPVSVSSYFSHLKSVFKVARTAWGYPLDKARFVEALDVLGELGVTGTSDSRDRRPTLDEVTRIVERMYSKWIAAPHTAPYHLIVLFAIFSTRRQSEITRMKWTDIDGADCRLLVFDMKDPKKKIGNHVFVDLTFEALRVARAAPRVGDVVFPISGNSISTEFKEVCRTLKIPDLRFHDLRHEGVSRLFEMSFDIPAVAMMSGHKTWVHLKRYAHIRKYGDKYKGWPFLDLVAPLPQRTA